MKLSVIISQMITDIYSHIIYLIDKKGYRYHSHIIYLLGKRDYYKIVICIKPILHFRHISTKIKHN